MTLRGIGVFRRCPLSLLFPSDLSREVSVGEAFSPNVPFEVVELSYLCETLRFVV